MLICSGGGWGSFCLRPRRKGCWYEVCPPVNVLKRMTKTTAMMRNKTKSEANDNSSIVVSSVSAAAGEGAAAGPVGRVEVGARLPEFGEEFFVERGLEVADALAAAGALLGAEHALDHLDVVVAPEREELVVRDERLGELVLLVTRLEVCDDFERGADAAVVERAPLVVVEGGVVGRRVEAAAREQREELFAERGRVHARAQAPAGELVVTEGAQDRVVLEARGELDLAELHRLEAARGVELVAEAEEVDRRHRLQDVDLRDEQFLDLGDPAEGARRDGRAVFAHRAERGVDLVEHLLEPQLVRLVDGDEEQLVVVRRVGQTALQPDQVLDAQVLVVRERGV